MQPSSSAVQASQQELSPSQLVLPFSELVINTDGLLSLGNKDLGSIINALAHDPQQTLIMISRDFPTESTNRHLAGGKVAAYYDQNVATRSPDGLAFFLEPYLDLGDPSLRQRPYYDQAVLYSAANPKRENFLHEFLHFLIYRHDRGRSIVIEDGSTRARADIVNETIIALRDQVRFSSQRLVDADDEHRPSAMKDDFQARLNLQAYRTTWLQRLAIGEELDVTYALHELRRELNLDHDFQVSNLWYHQSKYGELFFQLISQQQQLASSLEENAFLLNDRQIKDQWSAQKSAYCRWESKLNQDIAWYNQARLAVLNDQSTADKDVPARDSYPSQCL